MSSEGEALERRYAAIRREATLMAGAPGDLSQRALVYHHVFRHSGGNHVFPLLAAHGALWGKHYFALGMKVGRVLSVFDLHRPARRRARLLAFAAFADAFRDINRRVCVEVYATYRFTASSGEISGADRFVDPVLLDGLNRCHHARRQDRLLGRSERGALFEAFFRWEQHEVVGPSVDAAVEAFDWDRVRNLALRPKIHFAYIPHRKTLRFAHFANTAERIERGLEAYEIAEEVGWDEVEAVLSDYRVLPPDFLEEADALFAETRAKVLERASRQLEHPIPPSSLLSQQPGLARALLA